MTQNRSASEIEADDMAHLSCRWMLALMVGLELFMILLGPASRLVFESGLREMSPFLKILSGLGFMALLVATPLAIAAGLYCIVRWVRGRTHPEVDMVITMFAGVMLWPYAVMSIVNYGM